MKFTDGNWLMREGVTAHYAAEAYQARPSRIHLRSSLPAIQYGIAETPSQGPRSRYASPLPCQT